MGFLWTLLSLSKKTLGFELRLSDFVQEMTFSVNIVHALRPKSSYFRFSQQLSIEPHSDSQIDFLNYEPNTAFGTMQGRK